MTIRTPAPAGGHYHDPLATYDYCDDPLCPRVAGPVNWSALSARQDTALSLIMITADAAVQTWTGPDDAAELRTRLREVAAVARAAVNLHDQTAG